MPRSSAKRTRKTSAQEEAKVVIKLHDLNDKVLCRHIDNLYYEAKIISVEQTDGKERTYVVHYQGWNQRHDERITHTESQERFLHYTPENIERAKNELKDAQARALESKRKGKRPFTDGKKAGTESRGSTPSDKRAPSSSRAPSVTSEKLSTPTILSQTQNQAPNSSRKRKTVTGGDGEPVLKEPIRKKIDVHIEMPQALKEILLDDQDMIARQMYISRIPARFTVAEIIRQYAEYMGTSVEAKQTLKYEYAGGDDTKLKTMLVTMIESTYGIQDYFDTALGSQLLYKFERPQYIELLAKYNSDETKSSDSKSIKASEHYGFIHLLRLFIRFASMLSLTAWSEYAVAMITNHVRNFLKFLEVNRHKFLDIESDYVVSTPEYQKRVFNS